MANTIRELQALADETETLFKIIKISNSLWYNNQSFSKLAELQVLKYKIPLNVDEQPENNTFNKVHLKFC